MFLECIGQFFGHNYAIMPTIWSLANPFDESEPNPLTFAFNKQKQRMAASVSSALHLSR